MVLLTLTVVFLTLSTIFTILLFRGNVNSDPLLAFGVGAFKLDCPPDNSLVAEKAPTAGAPYFLEGDNVFVIYLKGELTSSFIHLYLFFYFWGWHRHSIIAFTIAT